MQQFNLISLLQSVQQRDFSKVHDFISINNQILVVLELLDVLKITSSDNQPNLELTVLGKAILSNEEIMFHIKQQNSTLQHITADLQRVKTALTAISFDVIKSQGLSQNVQSNSGLIPSRDQEAFNVPKSSNKMSAISSFNENNEQEIKAYLAELKNSLSKNELTHQNKNIELIIAKFKKINSLVQEKKFHDFGIESYLLIDGIFTFILVLFNKGEPESLNQSLSKKFELMKNLPIRIDSELIEFLDKFFNDTESNSEDSIKIGEKTAGKLIKLLNNVFESFINIFGLFIQ